MCLIGFSNKAIGHFAAKSSNGAASSPVKASLAFDATGINANKRIDKDGRGGYVIVGGEGAGDLVEATGVSDTQELERVPNSFAQCTLGCTLSCVEWQAALVARQMRRPKKAGFRMRQCLGPKSKPASWRRCREAKRAPFPAQFRAFANSPRLRLNRKANRRSVQAHAPGQ